MSNTHQKIVANRFRLRSPEVKDIIARPPRKLLVYGISVITGFMALVFCVSYFVHLPKMITSQASFIKEGGQLKAEVAIPAEYLTRLQGDEVARLVISGYPPDRFGYLKADIEPDCFSFAEDGRLIFTLSFPQLARSDRGETLRLREHQRAVVEIEVGRERLVQQLVEGI